MRYFRDNLLLQFSVFSFVVMAITAVILAIVLSNKVKSDAIDDLVAEAVGTSSGRLLGEITPVDLEAPMTGERYDRFHEFVQQSLVSERTARIKVVSVGPKEGTVIYSSDQASVGKTFPPPEPLLKALGGETVPILRVPEGVAHTAERELGTLMEVVTPIIFPGTTEPQGVLAIYQFYQPTAQRINDLRLWIIGSLAVGFVVLYAGLVTVVWGGSRTITRQRSELASVNVELENQVQVLRETQERLVRTERLAAIGELSAGVAHELRNPLGAIKNALYYIGSRVRGSDMAKDNPRMVEFLNVMDEEVDSSNAIITDLMDFSRVNPPSLSPTSLERVLDHALERMEVKESVAVVRDFQPGLPEVSADTEQLRRGLGNLLKNAEEAMPQGGTLTISGQASDGSVELQVRDTGRGIPEADLHKVFDPLFTTKPRGIGLGLAIVREVVERHRGSIEVASTEGEGTTFTIRLPSSQDSQNVGSGP